MSVRGTRLCLSILCLAVLASGCFLNPKKKSGGSDARKRFAVIKSKIYMNRIGDGTSARINFQTTEKVYCELAHYSQEEGGTPTEEDPVITACPNDEARNDFIIRIDGLSTSSLYWVKVTVFKNKESRSPKQTVLVQEKAGTGPDGEPGATEYEEIFVARLNVPQKTSEVHRHAFSSAKSLTEVKKALTRKTGCQSGFPASGSPYSKPASDFVLNSLATTSFASDKAINHPDFGGVRRLEYSGLNIGLDQWKFIYEREGTDYEIRARSGNTIQSVEIESAESALLPDPQLADAVDALVIDPSKDLVVKWETDANLLTSSYVQVYIGRPGNSNAVYCVFPAKDKRGSISQTFLEKLEVTKHVLLVMLESNQFLATDGWYVSTYDWRSGRVEKL